MPDADPSDAFMQTIMATLRANVGPGVIDNAEPEMTLRQRTVMTPAEIEATIKETTQVALNSGAFPTMVKPSADDQPPLKRSEFATVATSFSAAHNKESLARWSEYTVHSIVGKGGMGQIFRAGQNALRREVAIKKIIPEHLEKTGAAGAEGAAQMEASFVSEALVTGYLAHPNIVPVYSLGRDDDGKWFFSMKMVRGIEWRHLLHPERCNNPETKVQALARNLDVDDPVRRTAHLVENLRILLSVCNAVAFAHSKKFIHRDLKPENIMVGEFGEVLVMDWGLAVDVSETPHPVGSVEYRVPARTECGFGGTPAYMAPEQIAVDTAGHFTGASLNAWTDVFLLGAMLHEILAGTAPWSGPSISTVLVKVAGCEAPTFPQSVPPELAAICVKAMSKYPRARYADALEFQRSVEDFLKHRESTVIAAQADIEGKTQAIPNLARAVILYDQALKLWPQNSIALTRRETATSSLAALEVAARWTRNGFRVALAAIVIGLTTGFFWIRAEKLRAEASAKAASQTAKYMSRMLQVASPEQAKGKDISLLKMMLDIASKQVPVEFKDQPEVEASLRKAVGTTYRSLGLYAEAEAHLEAAFAIRTLVLGPENPETLTSMNDLAYLYQRQGRLEKSEVIHLKCLELRKRVLGNEDPETLVTMDDLAVVQWGRGKNSAGEKLCRETLEIRKRVLGVEHPRTLVSMSNLAVMLQEKNANLAEVETMQRQVLESQKRVLGANHPDTIFSMGNLANTLRAEGKIAEADALQHESLESKKKVLGPDHPDTYTPNSKMHTGEK